MDIGGQVLGGMVVAVLGYVLLEALHNWGAK